VVSSHAGSKDFSVHLSIQTASYLTNAWGTHLAVQHLQCESDHPQFPIAKVKNAISHMPSWFAMRKIYAFTLAQTQSEM